METTSLTLNDLTATFEALNASKSELLGPRAYYATQRNLAKIEPILRSYHKRRSLKIREMTDGQQEIGREHPRFGEFMAWMEKELETEVEISFHKFDVLSGEYQAFKPGHLAFLENRGILTVKEPE